MESAVDFHQALEQVDDLPCGVRQWRVHSRRKPVNEQLLRPLIMHPLNPDRLYKRCHQFDQRLNWLLLMRL